MDLRHLRSFVAVAEELSFRRAAERLHISQPPLSRQIQALEEELGVRLLERERNSRIALTDAGRTFLTDAKKTLRHAQTAIENARDSNAGAGGQLRIANIPRLSTIVLPPLLATFHQEFPRIDVSLVELEPTEQVLALREKRIHLGIFPDLGVPLDSRFESHPIFSCPMVAVLPPRHELASTSAELDLHALANETLLLPSSDATGYFARLDQLCAAAGFTPAATQEVIGVENILGMVAAGYGVAIFPEVLVSGAERTWKFRPLGSPVPPFRLRLLWVKKAPSLALQNFVAVARRSASEPVTKSPLRARVRPRVNAKRSQSASKPHR